MNNQTTLLQQFIRRLPLLSLGALSVGLGCQSSGLQPACYQPNADCRKTAGQDVRRSSADCERPYDFSKCAIPAPVGTYVRGWNEAMIGAAQTDRLVISRHEWFAGGHQLGPRGRQHVEELARSISAGAGHILIEAEPVELSQQETLDDALARTDDLNEMRRSMVVDALSAQGIEDAEERVVVMAIDRVGPRGIESPRIYNQMLRGGMGAGQRGGAGGGGMGAGGMGGGGGMAGGMGGGGFF